MFRLIKKSADISFSISWVCLTNSTCVFFKNQECKVREMVAKSKHMTFP